MKIKFYVENSIENEFEEDLKGLSQLLKVDHEVITWQKASAKAQTMDNPADAITSIMVYILDNGVAIAALIAALSNHLDKYKGKISCTYEGKEYKYEGLKQNEFYEFLMKIHSDQQR